MLPRILDFTHALRDAGVPVAISEDLDALRALAHVEMVDKESFRASLATTMIKSEAHRPAFDTLFDLYFGAGRGPKALDERDEQGANRAARPLPEGGDLVRGARDGSVERGGGVGAVAGRLETCLARKKRPGRKGGRAVGRTGRARLSTESEGPVLQPQSVG